MIWRNETYRHNMFGCNNGCLTSHRDDRVKISRRQSVGEIAEIVGEKCTDQRKVGAQRRLKQVALSVDIDFLLAFLNNRADASWR